MDGATAAARPAPRPEVQETMTTFHANVNSQERTTEDFSIKNQEQRRHCILVPDPSSERTIWNSMFGSTRCRI